MRTHYKPSLTLLMILFAAVSFTIAPMHTAFSQDNSEKDAWNKAVITNTIESLDSYLGKYPDGKYAKRVRAQKEALEKDTKRKEADSKAADEMMSTDKFGERFYLDPNALGPEYKLWRSLTIQDRGRTMFEPLSDVNELLESEMASLKLRDWPPELADKAGAKNFIYISIHSEQRVDNALARTLEGEGLLYQSDLPGLSKIAVMGIIPPTGAGSVFLFKGKVRLLQLDFWGDEEDPIRFVVMKDGRWVHLAGRGTVSTPDGKKLFSQLGAPTPDNDNPPKELQYENYFKFLFHNNIYSYVILKDGRGMKDIKGNPTKNENGDPKDVIFLSVFPNGKAISVAVAFSPFVYKSAIWDFREIPESDFLLIGAQHNESDLNEITHKIGVYRKSWKVLYFDKEGILHPLNELSANQDNPFVNIIFFEDQGAKTPLQLKGLSINIKGRSQKAYDYTIDEDGSLLVKKVTWEPLTISLVNNTTKNRWEYVLFPVVRSSVPRVVNYNIYHAFASHRK